MQTTLILGCGYTGRRIADLMEGSDDRIAPIVRTAESAGALEKYGRQPIIVDLDQRLQNGLPLAGSRVFYLAPPPDSGVADTRVSNFLHACESQGQPERILYFSTTGVYGDCGGDWVDESRPVNPGSDRARRRLDAEEQFRHWSRSGGGDLVIFRVAGIYGPGRLPLERLRRKLPLLQEDEAPFSNRIHVDDLASAAIAAMDRAAPGSLFNASDGHPSTMNDYFNRLADLSGLPRPPVVSRTEAAEVMSPGMLSYMQESRRLSVRALTQELGFEFRYPTLETGLPASLGSMET